MGKTVDPIKSFFRKYVSGVFLLMLLLSTIMWYITKLEYEYTARVPVDVDIEGNRFKVSCVATGTGYRLFSYRFFRNHDICINFHEVQTSPSVISNGDFVISAYSMQNAISARISDLKIVSIDELPEIQIPYQGE